MDPRVLKVFGVPPDMVEVLGALDDFQTITSFVVTPFVGIIPHPFDYQPNSGEVEAVVEVPLSVLLDPDNLRVEQREHSLEPAGYRIGKVRDQLSCTQGEDQPLALLGLEAEPVDVAGHDLPVNHRGQSDVHHLFGRRGRALLGLAEFGQLADVEDQRVRQPGRRFQPQFPRTGLGVRSDGHAHGHGLCNGRGRWILRIE